MGYLDQSTRYTAAYSNKKHLYSSEGPLFKDMQFYGRILLGLEEAAKRPAMICLSTPLKRIRRYQPA